MTYGARKQQGLDELRELLVKICLKQGLSKIDAELKATRTLTKIRLGLLERQKGKHLSWIKFQQDRHPRVDVLALVQEHCGLSEDKKLNVVQRRVAQLLAGDRVKPKKDWKERAAVKAKERIEANLLPKRSRGRPSGAGKAHPVELHPPGAMKPVTFLDVRLAVREVIEVVVPIIEDHAGRIHRSKRYDSHNALWKALLLFVPGAAHQRRANSISREITQYFSSP
jgi:hypothetical protein